MSLKYDHRQLADEMEICIFDEQVGAGLPLWLPNGVAIREELESFIKKLESQQGYLRVSSPHLAKKEIFESSGHLNNYSENMFPPMKDQSIEFYLRPMNCPFHHKIFAASLRSYRQLPLRIAEYGQVYRYENSGSLRGLSRVRGLCQNDAHIYVAPQQVAQEIENVLDLHEVCYSALGLKGYHYRLSLRDPLCPEDYVGDLEFWNQSEKILREALIKKNLNFYECRGEAAFYAPKIDIQMPMAYGGEESIASIQIDFNSAEKFDLKFVNHAGNNERPWIIHRAPLGSHERFIAMLLEYFEGQLPGWLSPIQLYLLPLNDEASVFCENIRQKLSRQSIRAFIDNHSGSLSKRILFAHKVRPFIKAVVGPKEVASQKLLLEFRDKKMEVDISLLDKLLVDFLQAP